MVEPSFDAPREIRKFVQAWAVAFTSKHEMLVSSSNRDILFMFILFSLVFKTRRGSQSTCLRKQPVRWALPTIFLMTMDVWWARPILRAKPDNRFGKRP